jgi:hypothetical protein
MIGATKGNVDLLVHDIFNDLTSVVATTRRRSSERRGASMDIFFQVIYQFYTVSNTLCGCAWLVSWPAALTQLSSFVRPYLPLINTTMMASFMSYFGARPDPKKSAREAILSLREQLNMFQKKEEYLQKRIDEDTKKAKVNAVTNKAGELALLPSHIAWSDDE